VAVERELFIFLVQIDSSDTLDIMSGQSSDNMSSVLGTLALNTNVTLTEKEEWIHRSFIVQLFYV